MASNSKALRPEWSEVSQEEFRKLYRTLRDVRDVSDMWRVPTKQLAYYGYIVDKHAVYATFSIPRRNGRDRRIDSPTRSLKYLQRIMHESLVRVYGPHPGVHGFHQSRSILTNAQNHLGQRYVLNVDLADFFPSITRKRIFGRLAAEPYGFQTPVANLVASLGTNAFSRLPQGSPSSPVLANMIAAELDTDLAQLCANFRCRYTRYADDITISVSRGELSPRLARYPNASGTGQVIIGDALANVVERHGFRINHRKSRLQSYWTRQMCTGLVVNGERPSPPRRYIRHLRSLIDHWRKNGWLDAVEILHQTEGGPVFENRGDLANYVNGKISYLKMARGPEDPICLKLDGIIAAISDSH